LAISGFLEVLRQCSVDPDCPGAEERLKKALNVLRCSPSAVVQDSALRGTRVHKAFVDFASTGQLAQGSDLLGYLSSLQHFIDEFKPEIIDVEQRVYSPSLRVAGTYDLYAKIDGQLVVIDWKTSKRIYDSHHLQAAAYEGMRRELGQHEATAMIVRLNPEGGVPEFVQTKATWDDFKACYALWQARKRIEAKEEAAA